MVLLVSSSIDPVSLRSAVCLDSSMISFASSVYLFMFRFSGNSHRLLSLTVSKVV